MNRRNRIKAMTITLKVNGKIALFIMSDKDGGINRLGSGSINDQDKDMFIGVTKKHVFRELCSKIDNNWFEFCGVYKVPEKKGIPCELTLVFQDDQDNNKGFQFIYGSESEGPPGDIIDFVENAVKLTDTWHVEQKAKVK